MEFLGTHILDAQIIGASPLMKHEVVQGLSFKMYFTIFTQANSIAIETELLFYGGDETEKEAKNRKFDELKKAQLRAIRFVEALNFDQTKWLQSKLPRDTAKVVLRNEALMADVRRRWFEGEAEDAIIATAQLAIA